MAPHELVHPGDGPRSEPSSISARLHSAKTASLPVFHATPRLSATRASVRCWQTITSSAHRNPRRESFARGSAAGEVSWRHTREHSRHRQRRIVTANVVGRPPQRSMGQASDHGVPYGPLAAVATTPLVRLQDAAGEHSPPWLEALACHRESELVETAESGQVSAHKPSNGARRDGSVGQVEVFRMACVRTSILGRPRRLSGHRRAALLDADHT